jgi:plasmid stabilization system protein ParE
MKRWRVVIELSAQHDIEDAYLWLADREPDAAMRWFNSIHDTIGSLQTFPERCPLAPETDFFDREIHQIFHGRRQHKYRILFTISERNVHVLHVRHGARLGLGESPTEE